MKLDSSSRIGAVRIGASPTEADGKDDGYATPTSLSAIDDGDLHSPPAPLLHDLAIITVSTNEAHWIRPCLTTAFSHIGDVSADVVVVDNESTDGTADLVAAEFPEARVVWSRNQG